MELEGLPRHVTVLFRRHYQISYHF